MDQHSEINFYIGDVSGSCWLKKNAHVPLCHPTAFQMHKITLPSLASDEACSLAQIAKGRGLKLRYTQKIFISTNFCHFC